jgi:hypothetical protein
MSLQGRKTIAAALPTSVSRFLVVRLTAVHMALPSGLVRGILPLSDVDGDQVMLVDETYSVTDLAQRLGLPQVSKSAQARMILCSIGGWRAAFPVEAVAGLVDVQRSQVVPLARQFRGQERQWFYGLFPFEETGALVVNVDWVVKASDRPARVIAEQSTTAVAPSQPLSKRRVVDLGGIQLEEATDAENTPWATI